MFRHTLRATQPNQERYYNSKTIGLEVIKRGGENAIFASNSIRDIIDKAKIDFLPNNLDVNVINDSSDYTINSVNDLMNNLIFGIILVVTVITFFLGIKNALFVGFAIPMKLINYQNLIEFFINKYFFNDYLFCLVLHTRK